MRTRILCLIAILFLGSAMLPSSVFARATKKYQVTGKVLEVSSDLIVVDKDGEKWEIARDANTKVTGQLKVGQKVTIEYRMSATNVENKDSGKEGGK
jgi:hypothetical protein